MSQNMFAAALALIVAVAVVAVAVYIVTSSTDRLVRGVASLGLTEVPWWLLRAARGRHRRPWGYADPKPPKVFHGVDMAVTFPTDPIAVAVDEHGRVHLVRPPDAPPYADAARLMAAFTPPVPDLAVRAAEILAHEEDAEHVAIPERTGAGAAEDWSPAAEIATELTMPVLSRTPTTPPDADELAILARFDDLVNRCWTEVPAWHLDFARENDAWLEAANVDPTPHKRWRQGALEWPTAAHALVRI